MLACGYLQISKQSSLTSTETGTTSTHINWTWERNDSIQLTMLIRSANAELQKTDVLVAVGLNATSTQFLTLSLNHYLNHTFVCKPHLSLKVADR